MTLSHSVLGADDAIEVMQGGSSSHTVSDAQTDHDNQLRWKDDPLAKLGSCKQSLMIMLDIHSNSGFVLLQSELALSGGAKHTVQACEQAVSDS